MCGEDVSPSLAMLPESTLQTPGSYYRLRTPIPQAQPRQLVWEHRERGFRPLSFSHPALLRDHNGIVLQVTTRLVVEGDKSVVDSGTAVRIEYRRNRLVQDCVENRAIDGCRCLDWSTIQKILSQLEIKPGWSINVNFETHPNGEFLIESTTHQHHFVGKEMPQGITLDRIALSSLCVKFAHGQTPDVFLVHISSNEASRQLKVFKAANKHDDLFSAATFFASLPGSDHIIRPTHIVVDESDRLRGLLMNYHSAGSLLHFYFSIYPPRPMMKLIPFGADVPTLSPGVFIPFDVKLAWAIDIVAALAWLHAQGIFWGDMHAGNVVLCDDGRCRLIDYFPDPRAWAPEWAPPELKSMSAQITRERDVFQLGLVLWAVAEEIAYFRRDVPFVRPSLPWRDITPVWYSDLANSCLETEPSDRPTASNIHTLLLSHID
ncbi:Protein kinase domain-containing protein [Mycena indigotica]|uniref:Protein kinase domain-containing protein n=1 Tax=Mycena indigotica TaxID=2126181 RepID=A0A8H6T709_9AGAR|nr:Protein kinase domain-containing protein [Mycena indigotica]KAF7311959.1 Protein kinase domain-containing protein [Mycena indigotica]